jgi:hypothetical protein
MQGTNYQECQERVRQLAAFPLPRILGPARVYKRIVTIFVVSFLLILLFSLLRGFLSSNPDKFSRWGLSAIWVGGYSIIFCVQFFSLSGMRKLLMWGTPALARVLFAKPTRKGAQIAYSYEISPGITTRCEGYVPRGQTLKEGMPIIVCYLPDRPERSVLVDYSMWKIELPREPKQSA